MILTLNTYDFLFASSPIKYYVVEHNDNPDIEEINYLGEELDLNDPESYDLAIDFLNDCKEHDREICDACKYPSLLGVFFGSNFNKIYDTINDTADTLIDLLTRKKNTLHTDEDLSCKTCCSCSGTDYCKTCQEVNTPEVYDEAEQASKAVSATGTCHWAQKYMDTVIDPASELSAAEYNTLLAMFTQYGDWLLKQ